MAKSMAFPFLPPPAIERELQSAAETHGGETSSCLYCDILAEEMKEGERIIVR